MNLFISITGRGHPGELEAEPDSTLICLRKLFIGLFLGAWLVFVFLVMLGRTAKVRQTKEDL